MLVPVDKEHEAVSDCDTSAMFGDCRSLRLDILGIESIPQWHTAPMGVQEPKLIPPLLSLAPNAPSQKDLPGVMWTLPADHRLLTLVHYNVLRAMLLNMSILSLLDNFPGTCGPVLSIPSFGVIPPHQIPPDLRPTLVQSSRPHPFWIDAIPFPKMRENIIVHLGTYDIDELRRDFGEGLYEGFDDVERRCCLVWGESWSMRGWEMSEGFMKKWGFLLQGCSTLVGSTNYWREIRGEDCIEAV
jgi:hypothetical protein